MEEEGGRILPGGIVLIDEPEHCHVTTFAASGEVLLALFARGGGNCGQVIIGLTAHQALQLIERLQTHADYYRSAIARGKGGARWPTPESEAISGAPSGGEPPTGA